MQAYGVTALTVVGADGDRRVAARDPAPGISRDERLVAEADDDRVGAKFRGGGDAGAE